AVQLPDQPLVQVQDRHLASLTDIPHNAVNRLALVIFRFARGNIVKVHSTFGQVNESSVPVDANDTGRLDASNTGELLDGPNASARQFRQLNQPSTLLYSSNST